MFDVLDTPTKLCRGWSRRQLLRVGSFGAVGHSLPNLLAAAAKPTDLPVRNRMFGRAKNLIYLFLQGGPPQHETFDPKPKAPVEIRGEHHPISTNIPGIQFCELLPRTARIADKLAVIRSLSTNDNVHSSSGYWVLTGNKYRGPNARTIQPTDWPYFGSLIKMFKPSETLPALSTVWIPDIMRLNESVTPAGQSAGFLGNRWHPDRFVGDPARADYKVEGLSVDSIPPLRLERRMALLDEIDAHFSAVKRSQIVSSYDSFQQQAFDLMTSGAARDAFDIEKEPQAVRDRYGRYTWGQACLLARRLIEAGVRMVHVNWPREPGDNAVDNPLWDTHARNADRLEDVLCPKFDVTFTALLEDLDERGLLDETLVVAVGEFGRTPKINAKGGRDHWGPVFSCVMAGAGISGGQVYGASDKNGAYPIQDRVEGGDLTATIFHLMGINPLGMFVDPAGRPHRLTEGEPLFKLLGSEPATPARVPPGGDVARVPRYNPALLLNTDFEDATLRSYEGPSRPQGWRAYPDPNAEPTSGLFVDIARSKDSSIARIVIDASPENQSRQIKPETSAGFAQEVRSPFAGHYRLSLKFRGRAASKEQFAAVFGASIRCRLTFFGFNDREKSPLKRRELAGIDFTPDFATDADEWQTVRLEKAFVNPTPGANFSFGNGLGVAAYVQVTQVVPMPPTPVFLEIDRLDLEFQGKERIDSVKV
jgi:hypothetical protein